MDHVLRATLLSLTLLGISCCSVIETPQEGYPADSTSAVKNCVQWFAKLDAAVDSAGVRDASAHPIPGFPYLRTDRFLGSFRNAAADDPSRFAYWVSRLRNLDATARAYEVRNLPSPSLALLGIASVGAAAARTEACAAELSRAELATAEQRERLIERAQVPDEYIERNRILGLYPLATLPLSVGVVRWQDATLAMFRREAAGGDRSHNLVRYEPSGHPLGAAQLRAIFAQARTDPLGTPQLSRTDRQRLLETFAPIFEIDTTGAYDRFGPLAWGTGPAPEVDIADPVVYRRISYTRYGRRVLVQLVYTIWFPERPREAVFDLLSGRLDGLVFRVTLDPEARPLVYDTIHACGCYHMFFPTQRVHLRPAPQPGIEWAFVPATLPLVDPAQRLVLQVGSRSHSIIAVHFDGGGRGATYRFAEEDDLRALPSPGGTTRSAFGPDGIVPGTGRAERILFWPTGVDDVGAMRQWGKHATAFLGRRHFDDPDLIERRFSIGSEQDSLRGYASAGARGYLR